MSPEKNPFLKPPSKPTNKDTAAFIESVLNKKEGDKARKVIGNTIKKETKPALEFTDLQLTDKEKARAEAYEDNRPWTEERVIKWAISFGQTEEWVNDGFTFHEDGSITVVRNLSLNKRAITELPRGIKSIEGYLNLEGSNIVSLKNLDSTSIRAGLSLIGIPAADIPAGVRIGARIWVNKNQAQLITSLKKNGYADKLIDEDNNPIR